MNHQSKPEQRPLHSGPMASNKAWVKSMLRPLHPIHLSPTVACTVWPVVGFKMVKLLPHLGLSLDSVPMNSKGKAICMSLLVSMFQPQAPRPPSQYVMSPWQAAPSPSQVLVALATDSTLAKPLDPLFPLEAGAGEEATGAGEDGDAATGAGVVVLLGAKVGCWATGLEVVTIVVDGEAGWGATTAAGVLVLVTVGAAFGAVGMAGRPPLGSSVETTAPAALTHTVTGTSTVVQAVSVTISGDG